MQVSFQLSNILKTYPRTGTDCRLLLTRESHDKN